MNENTLPRDYCGMPRHVM